jgi:hypothetical protein
VAAIFSVALNVLLAILLVGRLLWLGHRYRQAFGKSGDIYPYVSPASIIVESAVLYTVPKLIANAMNFVSQASRNASIPGALADVTVVSTCGLSIDRRAYCINQAIAPLLISYRALKGCLLTRETIQELDGRMTTRTTQDVETGRIDEPAMIFVVQETEKYVEHGHEKDVLGVSKKLLS